MKGRMPWAPLVALAGTTLLAGCYYDPATGLTYASPPPPAYGYPQPPPATASEGPAPEGPGPAYGMPPEGDYGGPPPAGYSGPPPAQGYGAPPTGGYGAYGGAAAPGYGAPPPSGPGITRAEFVARAEQRAQARNRDPQQAGERAGAIFDQIDINHAGVVTQAQIRAWRAAHRPSTTQGQSPGPPPPPAEYD
jgi:hypothetical protein